MPARLHPRHGVPVSFSVPVADLLPEHDEQPRISTPPPLDCGWAVELVCRTVEIVAGERCVPMRELAVHPRVLNSLRVAAGSRPELLRPRIQSVRMQRTDGLTGVVCLVLCGRSYRAVTADFRPHRSGWWMTHFGVL